MPTLADRQTGERVSSLACIEDGGIKFTPHPGQWRAWCSDKRFVVVLAGTQGGKTSFGPHWLYREMQLAGPGDYIVVAPTYPLLDVKLFPEFLRLFKDWLDLGEMSGGPRRKFLLSPEGCRRTWPGWVEGRDEPGRVIFGHAQDPDSLESATCRGAWLDEAGQNKFKLDSFEAVLRRLSLAQGRVLVTTTPYNLGWLKQQLYDPWRNGASDIDVINFKSIDNPSFPKAEYDRARRTLPRWKFEMFYNAVFTRPAGLIYDCFIDEFKAENPAGHLVERFDLPAHWPRYLGVDFGGVHTAGIFIAREVESLPSPYNPYGFVILPPTPDEIEHASGKCYVYREYLGGGRSAKQHAKHLRYDEPEHIFACGGARSEGQWRLEFAMQGLPIVEPLFSDVEVGINLVYSAFQDHQVYVFDDLLKFRGELTTYSREVDENGQPTEKIADKNEYHRLDAFRYIVPRIIGVNMEPDVI